MSTAPSRLPAIAAVGALLVLLPMAPVTAHDVVAEQVVEMAVEPQGDRLLVRLHVPIAVVGEANLPPLSNGLLDATMVDGPLRIVAVDLAHNLDVQQADVVLPPPAATARVGADRASIDIDLRYAIRPDTAGFSARLNAWRANAGPVRTNLHYRLPSGHAYVISVADPRLRVTFDPDRAEVVQQFATRGLRALLDGGDHLLFLVCVLLPLRRARSAATLFAAGALGQTIAITMSILQPSTAVASLPALATIAASAVVIAALQNIVRADLRWVVLLAFAFGALNGAAFGTTLAESMQFGGLHRLVAVTGFAVVALVGELWLGALVWATRTWLTERAVSEQVVSILGSVLIAHSAVHRVLDRGHILAQAGWFGGGRALVWLTLAWACVMLLVAVVNAITGRAVASPDPRSAAEAASES